MFYTSASLTKVKDRPGKPWRGTLEYKDEQGRRRQIRKVFSGIKLKKDAQVALWKWREEMEEKAASIRSERLLGDTVVAHLENQLRAGRISKVTFQNSMRLFRKSVDPIIGGKVFEEMGRSDFQLFVDELSLTYKPQSVRTIFAIVSKAYKAELRLGNIDEDPTRFVILPRVARSGVNYLDETSRRRFFSLLNKECNFYLPAMIAFYTGMRAGEICALEWGDVDFSFRVINVRRSAKEYRNSRGGKEVEISHTKTFKSRTIPIVPQLEAILWDAKHASKSDFVIAQRNPRLLCTSFLKWSQRHGVLGSLKKPITMHGLRHTFATLGVHSSMDVKSLSSILGHTTVAMTIDIYAADDEVAKKAAMDRLGLFLRDS